MPSLFKRNKRAIRLKEELLQMFLPFTHLEYTYAVHITSNYLLESYRYTIYYFNYNMPEILTIFRLSIFIVIDILDYAHCKYSMYYYILLWMRKWTVMHSIKRDVSRESVGLRIPNAQHRRAFVLMSFIFVHRYTNNQNDTIKNDVSRKNVGKVCFE